MTVKQTDTLVDVLQALESTRQAHTHAQRDAIVVDPDGIFLGKVNMIDIFRALEPNYKKLMSKSGAGTLTKAFVMKTVKEFNLWMGVDPPRFFFDLPPLIPSDPVIGAHVDSGGGIELNHHFLSTPLAKV